MARYNDRNEHSSALDSATPPVMTVDDAHHQYEQAMRGAGLSSVRVTTDRNGQGQIFGIRVPKTLQPVVEITLANVMPYLQRHGSEFVHNGTKSLAGKFEFTKGSAQPIALVAENVFRWGLITSKHITDIIHANRSYAQARRELYAELTPVMHATKANYKNNEVIQNAFNQLHQDMVTDLKMVAADLPTIVPTALFALQDQAALAEKRKAEAKAKEIKTQTVDQSVERRFQEQMQMMEREVNLRTKVDAALEKKKSEYIASGIKEGRKDPKGKVLTEKALGDEFDGRMRYIRGQVEEDIRHQEREARSAKNSKQQEVEKKNKYENMMPWVIPAASAVSQMFKTGIEERARQREGKVNAWEMIKHLKLELEEECGRTGENCDRSFTTRSADEIYITGMGKHDGERISLRDFIIDIFQQHERDRTGEVTTASNGKKIREPLGPSLVAKMMPSIDLISEEIACGRLDPNALVTLVGENKVVIHQEKGARRFADIKDVHKSVDELLAVMSTRDRVTPEEFFANFADPALIEKTLKENLASMRGSEKAFFASLFPDDILKQAGLDKETILELRKQAHGRMYDIVAATVVTMAKRDPEHLKAMGLTDQDMQHIQELATHIEEGDFQAVKVAVDGRDKSILAALRTLGLNEQSTKKGDGENFWTKRVQESTKIQEIAGKHSDSARDRVSKRREEGNETQEDIYRA